MKLKITSKRAIMLMLCFVALCSVICITAFAADCTHSGLNADGWELVSETTCSQIGKERQWCFTCNEWVTRDADAELDPDAHIAGPWTVVIPNTCEAKGKEARYCILCTDDETGEPTLIETRDIPAHNYEVVVLRPATCMREGYELKTCMTCYDVVNTTLEIDPDAHELSEWYVTTEATCVTDSGVRTRVCINTDVNSNKCTYKETETYSDPKNHTEIIWDDSLRRAPSCDAPGYMVGTCQGCNAQVMEEIAQHSESKIVEVLNVKEATCTKNGTKTVRCECGLVYDIEIPADETKNHVYTEWRIEKEPGCKPGKRVKYCKHHYQTVKVEEKIPATGEHIFTEWTEKIKADCSKTGLDERTCTECGLVEKRELPTHHDLAIWTTVTEMSCDEKSITEGMKFAKCNNCTYTDYFTVPAVHSFGEWKVVKHTNCKNMNVTGKMERTCSGCGKVESKTFSAEHDYTDWFVTEKPACDVAGGKSGVMTRWCNTCRKVEHKPVAANHEFESVETVKFATCTENGLEKVECRYCGFVSERETEKADHYYVEADGCKKECKLCGTKADNHEFGNWTKDGGFTCGNTSAMLTRTCKKCKTATETQTVSLNHPNLKTTVVEPTCAASGYTNKSCPDCGYSVSMTDVKPALGHELEKNWTTRIEPTCYSGGARYKECVNCDYVEYQYIAKAEHVLIEIEPGIEPTCVDAGLSAKSYCGMCRTVFEAEVIPATGHSYFEDDESCLVCRAYRGSNDCACDCHSTNATKQMFFKILNKLFSFFGLNQECKCGILHYEEVGFFGKLFAKKEA